MAVCVLGAGLAIASLATAATSATAQPVANAADCADLFRFAHNPVPVAKTADGQTTLATIRWGYNATHNICYLVLDDDAVAALRANAPTSSAAPPWDQAAANRCQRAYNPNRGFADQPVPVAKTADGQTTLATIRWGYNATHNLCYLVLDDTANTALRTAHQQTSPAGTYTAITVGLNHSCAIAADGQAVCWGDNRDGQADPPDGTYTAIAAGEFHSCAVATGGQAVCWDWRTNLPAKVSWVA